MKSISTLFLIFVILPLLAISTSGISNPVWLGVSSQDYTDYRILNVPLKPNDNPVKVPYMGKGYAWYAVQGLRNGIWENAPMFTSVCFQDEQNNEFHFMTGFVNYPKSNSPVFVNSNEFAVQVSSTDIGAGLIGSSENYTAISVNGISLLSENQITTDFLVSDIDHDIEWLYQYKVKPGFGLGVGFASIGKEYEYGQGGSIKIKVSESSNDWDTLFVKRNIDSAAGVVANVGAPRLLGLNLGADINIENCASQVDEYAFNKNELNGIKAMYCEYLFLEPLMAWNKLLPKPLSFIKLLGSTILAYSVQQGYDLALNRQSDDIQLTTRVGLGIDCSFRPLNQSINKNLGVALNFSCGAESYAGSNIKLFSDNGFEKSINIGGNCSVDGGAGIKPLKSNNRYKLNLTGFDFNMNFKHTLTQKLRDGHISYKYENVYSAAEAYAPNFVGANSDGIECTDWIEMNNNETVQTLLQSSVLANQLNNVGDINQDFDFSNHTFSSNIENFLDNVIINQNYDENDCITYGTFVKNLEESPLNIDIGKVETPLYFSLGLDLSLGKYERVPFRSGRWIKGSPYIDFQGLDYSSSSLEFSDINDYLWEKIYQDVNWLDFLGLYSDTFLDNLFGNIDEQLTYYLNDLGSSIKLTVSSMPSLIEEGICEFWTWGDESNNQSFPESVRSQIQTYNKAVRNQRELLAGMKYGIGGFFDLTPSNAEFADTTYISIKYSDAEVVDIDESTLAVYYCDELGLWHYLPSIVFADSNRVEARIYQFRTYTLAPRLPQSSFNLLSNPDSLMADNAAIAHIVSEIVFNNDGTSIEDGTIFTISASAGTIIANDIEPSVEGIQIISNSGILSFDIKADSLAVPIIVTASSIYGFASGSLTLHQYTHVIPDTTHIVSFSSGHKSIHLNWQTVYNPNIIGYRIYFDNDESGAPYNGLTDYSGLPSPVNVGLCTDYTLTGLTNNTPYYVTITVVDISGNESPYCDEIIATPVLITAQNVVLTIQNNTVLITWDEVDGASGYKVYASENPVDDISEAQLLGHTTANEYVDIDLLIRRFYTIIVVAY